LLVDFGDDRPIFSLAIWSVIFDNVHLCCSVYPWILSIWVFEWWQRTCWC